MSDVLITGMALTKQTPVRSGLPLVSAARVYVFTDTAHTILDREFDITAVEHAAMVADGFSPPPGVTQLEYDEGRWVCWGKRMTEIGDTELTSSGHVFVLYHKKFDGVKTVEKYMLFEPSEYTGVYPDILVSETALALVPGKEIVSFKGGVLETVDNP